MSIQQGSMNDWLVEIKKALANLAFSACKRPLTEVDQAMKLKLENELERLLKELSR